MNPDLLNLLRAVDTPTVCNAIEVAQGKRGFNAFTRGTMIASDQQRLRWWALPSPRKSPHSPHQQKPLM